MFCLDYALSFALYSALHSWAVRRKWPGVEDPRRPQLAFSAAAGGFAGLGSALLLYPFDFVRQTSVAKGTSSFALSSIPFTAVYLGVYFSARDPDSAASRAGWALAATAGAAAAELPFDHAKLAIAGSGGRAAAMAAARVPLGALLLFAFDGLVSGQPRKQSSGAQHSQLYSAAAPEQ